MKPLSSSRARLTAAVRAASPAPVLLASWLVALIYAFPGQLSEQAAAALEEARAGAPSDAVSAPMVALWRLTDGVIDGPAGLWVLQSLLVLGGLHAVACRLLAPRPAAWVAAGTFLAPPVLVSTAVLSPHALSAGLLLWACAALAAPRAAPARLAWLAAPARLAGLARLARRPAPTWLAGLAAIAAATAISSSSALIALPLVLGLLPGLLPGPPPAPADGHQVERARWRTPWLARAVAGLAWLAAAALGLGAAAALTATPTELPRSRLDLADLTGIAARAQLADAAPARRFLAQLPPDHRADDLAPAQRTALRQLAGDARRQHQGAYLGHRLSLTATLLVAPAAAGPPPILPSDLAAALQARSRPSTAQRLLTAGARALAAVPPLFVPALYLALALALLPWARRHRLRLALVTSALISLVAAAGLAAEASFGHALWLVLAATLGAALWLARRCPGPQVAAAPPPAADAIAPPAADAIEPRPAAVAISSGQRLATWATPRRVLLAGWCVFLLYAFPGYMSYDSVFQLLEARSGRYSNGHPPLMAALWATVELFVSGPLGMLLLQSGCFLAGTFLIAQRTVSARSAALCAVGLLWFAPIGSVLAVIWKDSQMCAFLVLGTAFLLSSRRSVRMAGLGVLVLATGMRHNALTITLPLVTLLFVWDPAHRGLRRYALALVAWLAITLTARTAANALTSTRLDLWHQSIALFDLIGTRHFLPPASDTELQLALAGTPLAVESGLQAAAAIDDRAGFFDGIYQARARMFRPTLTESERAAVTSAWQATVLGHPVAFLRYRARAALEILELSAAPPPRIYRSFTDHQDPARNAERLQHDASTSAVQRWLQKRMSFVFRLSVSRVWAACLLTLLLVPLCLRHRAALAILLSGLTGELALMLVSPAADSRYSVWLAVAAGLGLCLQVGRRAGGKPALPGNGLDVPPPTAPGAAS